MNRTIETLRVSVSDRCNHRCLYCMPAEGVPLCAHDDMLRYEEIVEITRLLAERFGVRRVRLTGGEPLLRRNIVGLVHMLSRIGLDEVLLTTNGCLLEHHAADLNAAGLSRVNVSVDTLDPECYRRITRGGELAPVLRGVDAALRVGLRRLKINTVVLRHENDRELPRLLRFAMGKGVEIRFLEMIAIGAAATCHERYFVPLSEILSVLAKDFEIETLPRTWPGPATAHVLTDKSTARRVKIGTIASETHPFCSTCDRLRLTSTGELRACLMSPAGADMRKWLRRDKRDMNEFDEIVRSVIAMKPALRGRRAFHQMSQVGG